MPYIPKEDRDELNTRQPETAGELNYLYTLELLKYFKLRGSNYNAIHELQIGINKFIENDTDHTLSNILLNIDTGSILKEDLKAAVQLAFMEFYRRVAAPYEDNKILQNGDVYK